jgi:uncharacterized membrane protein YidH (DUF202 family)
MSFNPRILVGVVLIIGGILAIVMGSVTYTEESHSADLGPIELSVEEEETVNIPVWAGGAAIVAGALVLAIRRRS